MISPLSGHCRREGLGLSSLLPTVRPQIEATIELLIFLLDQFDGDENLEDCAGAMPELDLAEWGIADGDALYDPEITFDRLLFRFDGSGELIAKALLEEITRASSARERLKDILPLESQGAIGD